MKTGEVEQVLLKLKDPLAASEPKEIERTPCPMCDRSFKVTIPSSQSGKIKLGASSDQMTIRKTHSTLIYAPSECVWSLST